jgi:hypothetical protein
MYYFLGMHAYWWVSGVFVWMLFFSLTGTNQATHSKVAAGHCSGLN